MPDRVWLRRSRARIGPVQHVRASVDRVARARPVSRALLPQWAARLIGFAALGLIGALEWKRLVGGLSDGRALLWVLAAVGAALGVLAAGRARDGWPRATALAGAVVFGLFLGYLASRIPLHYLRPRRWDDFWSGITTGTQALGTVKLPYVSVDPWPGYALKLLGAELLVLAALMTFWPRAQAEPGRRAPLSPPDRGYPFLALAVLLIVVASPVVSLGGKSSLLLGLAIATMTVCFLWLERLPLRPGLGVAALAAIALVGALPIASVADRGEAWFDYRAFAEGLGPDDPVRFDWSQSYGPIDWPRDGNEVMRVKSAKPHYWKARDLDVFDGVSWGVRTDATPAQRNGDQSWEADLPEDYRDRPAFSDRISVSVRRMRTSDVIGAGTVLKVEDASRDVRPGLASGTWDSIGAMRRGDSYTLDIYTPDPQPFELSRASIGDKQGELNLTIPLLPGRRLSRVDQRVRQGVAHFPPYGGITGPSVDFPGMVLPERYDIDKVMRNSYYARTWRLVKRLKRGTKTPFDYIKKVDDYLHQSDFHYNERPAAVPRNRAPLDYFINDSHDGYCQHYAGAMALMLRMGGIPARVATGFSPGGYSDRHKAWIVRDTDAHAWVEVWFESFGWVTIDPTPDATPARSQIATLTTPANETPLAADRATPGAGDTGGSVRGPLGVRRELLLENDPNGASLEKGGVPRWVWGAGIVAALLALFVCIALWRRPRGAVPELEDALRRLGRPITPSTTLHQLERRIGSHSPEAAGYLRALTAGRYAPAPPRPTRAGRRALRRALAAGLGPTGRLRALWALPPRVRSR
jgi:transglutaminase-like putative cysteine protease